MQGSSLFYRIFCTKIQGQILMERKNFFFFCCIAAVIVIHLPQKKINEQKCKQIVNNVISKSR